MASLRTAKLQKKYSEYRKKQSPNIPCPLCTDKVVHTFRFWKIMKNKFPYDLIASKHHMIVPIRHVTEEFLNKEELDELNIIKAGYINENYECIIEATNKKKTIPSHFHKHLLVIKKIEK